MSNGVQKSCSRCRKDILCNAEAIEKCHCYQVEISADCREYLKETKYNCLCNQCLVEVNELVEKAHSLPTKPVENVHYYMDKGLLVFTELNHIQRGYCCGSGCRHCAYGFKINSPQ